MTMFTLSLLLHLVSVQAAPDYVISFSATSPTETLEQVEAKARVLSVSTGNGEVSVRRSPPSILANISAAAANEVRGLTGVQSVELDPPAPAPVHPEVTASPTASDPVLDRRIEFEDDLAQDRGHFLHTEIKRLARETGSGFCKLFENGMIKASLSRSAAGAVAAMEGIREVTDASGDSDVDACPLRLAGPQDPAQ